VPADCAEIVPEVFSRPSPFSIAMPALSAISTVTVKIIETK
jgi:hypothetical protein